MILLFTFNAELKEGTLNWGKQYLTYDLKATIKLHRQLLQPSKSDFGEGEPPSRY